MSDETLRDRFAMAAPHEEVDGIIGGSIEQAAKFIGIDGRDYQYDTHYFKAVAKARFMWADAMMQARLPAPELAKGEPAPEAVTPRSQVQVFGEAAPQTWDDYERGCLLTYGGGHHEPETIEAFRHGMQTVFNLLRREFPPAEVCKALKAKGGAT